jgi:hypothetical protein
MLGETVVIDPGGAIVTIFNVSWVLLFQLFQALSSAAKACSLRIEIKAIWPI